MRIGTTTNGCVYGSGESEYKKLKSYGFDAVDFRMLDAFSAFYTADEGESEKIIYREKEAAAEAGIEICQTHGPWWSVEVYMNEKTLAQEKERMKRSIRLTEKLGCTNWVIHPIMPFGVEDAGTPNAEKTFEMNVKFMTEMALYASDYGITVCYENMPFLKLSVSTPTQIHDVVKAVDMANFKICLDTGHCGAWDISPADAVRELGSDIRAFHIHDTHKGIDEHLLPYFGIIDWEDFSNALQETGFTGVVSFETVPPAALPPEIYYRFLADIAKHIGKCR